jgi:hypothetical protein
MKKYYLPLLMAFTCMLGLAQEMPIAYTFGEKYHDKYKYSNLVSVSEDNQGGFVLVRAYYTGLILTPKGYFIERYNKDLELVSEYNYKLRGPELVEGYVKNGQLYLLFLRYDEVGLSYNYVIHRSPLEDFKFTEQPLLKVYSGAVRNPLDRNYYNRNFNSGFTTTVLFNEQKSAFIISTHFKKGKENKHLIHMYNASLDKLGEYDFSDEVEEKNYAFENVAFSPDLERAYIVGKAYYKKRRFSALERKFQYELVSLSREGVKTQTFDDPDKYSEGLKPVLKGNKLICVGFYADRKDNRYNGLAYFELNALNLAITTKKYNPFSPEFMFDKFGKEDDKEIKNLVFKSVNFTADNHMLFNAEEYFVTSSIQNNGSGGRLQIERYHHNDIVSAKLSPSGDMVWARNINKAEVTQGDGAYASYSSYTKGDNTYFFICTAADNPQLLNNERIIFKQGLSQNRNVFVIQLNEAGKMSYEKIIDSQEARLPLMVSKPLVDEQENELLFYAKRGNKKQLVKVEMR